MRRRDVEEAQLVRTLLVVAFGDLHRIARIHEIYEIYALYDASVFDVEARDDPLCKLVHGDLPSVKFYNFSQILLNIMTL